MESRLRVVAFILGLALLVLGSNPLSAQLTPNETADENNFNETYGDSILGATPVAEAPFSADVEVVWRGPNTGPSEWRATGRYYRDSIGRVRVEQMFANSVRRHGPPRIIVSPDPHARAVYVLDSATSRANKVPRGYALQTVGGAHWVVLPISSACFIAFSRPQRINNFLDREGWGSNVLAIKEELLGERSIGGVQVTGVRFTATVPVAAAYGSGHLIPVTYEQWRSPELKLEMSSRSEDADAGVVETRMNIISRDDPPALLFELPAGYEPSADYQVEPTTWPNPYVPELWPTGQRLCPALPNLK